LVVTTRTGEVRNRSFTLTYEVRRKGDGALVCEGSSAQVWLDADGTPAQLPEHVRAALTSHG
jgi:acyl-CoA thioesterase FadM